MRTTVAFVVASLSLLTAACGSPFESVRDPIPDTGTDSGDPAEASKPDHEGSHPEAGHEGGPCKSCLDARTDSDAGLDTGKPEGGPVEAGKDVVTVGEGGKETGPTDSAPPPVSNVYWAGSGGAAQLQSISVDGGTATAIGGPGVSGFAVDSVNIYWSDPVATAVLSAPLAGGATTTVANGLVPPFLDSPGPVAVNATGIYWVDATDNTITGAVKGVPGYSHLATGPAPANFIAVDATTIYFTTDGSGGCVLSVPLAGGTPTTLASAEGTITGITVDATNVYWITSGVVCSPEGGACSGTVRKLNKSGPPIFTTLASGQAGPAGIAVDSTYVYWTNSGSSALHGDVLRTPIASGTITVLASVQVRPQGIVVDDVNAYWVNNGTPPLYKDGTVMSVPLTGGTPSTLISGQKFPQNIGIAK